MKWRFSLAYPVLALVSFAALAVALPLYFISVNSLKKGIDAMELSKAKQVHHIAETGIKTEIDKVMVLSKTLERHRDVIEALRHFNTSGDREALTKRVEPIVRSLDVGFAKIIDANEQIVYRYNSMISAEMNIWGVSEALQGREIVATSRHAEGFAIRAIAPVRDDNNRILGAIIVGFVINDDFADRISSLTNTNILIGSTQGVIAASHDIEKDKKHLCKNDLLVKDMILQSIKDDKTLYKTICENNEIHYYKRLLIVDEMFSLMVKVNTSESQQLFSETRRKIAATAGIAFVIAWFLGITFTGALIKPLQELRDQSCHTVKQITGQTVEKQGGNELGALVSAFAIMRDSLVRYIDGLQEAEAKLRQHRDHLEELVAERTENLKRVNEQLRDEINDRERIEQDLKQTNIKLNNSNQQIQEFLYVASHDLREPLRKISAFTQMLTNSLSGRLNDDEQENFGFVLEGTVKMRQIVESLLSYSRLMSREPRFSEVDLNKIVDDLMDSELPTQLKESGGKLIVPEPLPVARADATQIWQLFENLIVNAVKYRREDIALQITIRAQNEDNGMVRIEIEDNGIGIKSEYCQSVFAMFHRLHHRDQYGGVGVGLAMCKRIVEQHDGEIGVNSTYGQGSTFWFTLPAAQTLEECQTGLERSIEP